MRKVIAILLAVGSFFQASANALTIKNADAFAPGDGKAIYDTTSGLTWLDFGINNGVSFYKVVTQLEEGKYPGWRLPTETEVLHLFKGLMPHFDLPDQLTGSVQNYFQPEGFDLIWSDIYSIWGVNYHPDLESPFYSYLSRGFFLGNDGINYSAGMREFILTGTLPEEAPIYVHLTVFDILDNYYVSEDDPASSTFLVRDTPIATVFEPSSVSLLLLGLCLAWFRTFHSRN